MVPAPETAFKGIHKLMAAFCALVAHDGKWTTPRYWEPDFREDADTSFADAAEEMIGLLSTSVSRLDDGESTGAF